MCFVEYRGWTISNFVDCNNPNNMNIPRPVDLCISDFASGAGGYPSTFVDLYSEKEISKKVETIRKSFFIKVARGSPLPDTLRNILKLIHW